MLRLSSDILPMYTHKDWSYFYKQPDVINFLEKSFSPIGEYARNNGIRLSMHPGQFCCIVSDKDEVVQSSLEELEYHADIIRWLGYGKEKLDFKLNIHLSGKRGIYGFDDAWSLMSDTVRNCLTLENDEYQQGIDDLILLIDKVGIVLDIHHHLIMTGEYIHDTDPRIRMVQDSWQGRRPVIHYSQSRDEYIGSLSDRLPSMQDMLLSNTKASLREHSDFYTNQHINKWALSHMSWADIMAESKGKNIAAMELFESARIL